VVNKQPSWIDIAAVDDLPPGNAREAVVGGEMVAVFNVDGEFYALDGVCPHQGGPLGQGSLSGTTVTCPWHGWQFDVTTGKHLLSPRETPRWEVRQREGRLEVRRMAH